MKVHRKRKVQQYFEKRAFCDVCNDFIYSGNSEQVSRSLIAHRSSSIEHRNRMKMKNEEEGSQSERNGNGAKMKKSPMFTWSIAKVRALKSLSSMICLI